MFKDNLVRPVHKDNSLTDWSNALKAICNRCYLPITLHSVWNGAKNYWVALNLDGTRHRHLLPIEGPNQR